MTFDVASMDLKQLAEAASSGGIAALEELAATGKVAGPKVTEDPPPDPEAESGATPEASSDQAVPEGVSEVPPATSQDKDHATAVSTKDGKGTIPYSVLKGARERAAQVEQQNEVLRKQLDDLTARLNSGTAPTDTQAAQASEATDEVDARISAMQEKAAALKDEFPELAELLTGQIEMLQATRKQLIEVSGRYEAERASREAEEQARVGETLQEAIDGNPTLSAWQEKAGAEWDAAVEMDAMLRAKPEWADKSFADRFAKVVELVGVMNPEFATPPSKAADVPASDGKDKQATPSDKRPPVNSLSDIPGGVPPAAGKREQVEELSGAALGNRFMTMTPDQIADYLASLAM